MLQRSSKDIDRRFDSRSLQLKDKMAGIGESRTSELFLSVVIIWASRSNIVVNYFGKLNLCLSLITKIFWTDYIYTYIKPKRKD